MRILRIACERSNSQNPWPRLTFPTKFANSHNSQPPLSRHAHPVESRATRAFGERSNGHDPFPRLRFRSMLSCSHCSRHPHQYLVRTRIRQRYHGGLLLRPSTATHSHGGYRWRSPLAPDVARHMSLGPTAPGRVARLLPWPSAWSRQYAFAGSLPCGPGTPPRMKSSPNFNAVSRRVAPPIVRR